MKNLDKQRRKETGYAVFCAVLLVMPIIFMVLLNVIFAGRLDPNSVSLISIVSMIVFWGVAVFVVKKHLYNMIVIDAMSKNGKRLYTDRRFFASNRENTEAAAILADLVAAGFAADEKEPSLAKKGLCGVWVLEGEVDYKAFLTEKKAELDKSYSGKKHLSYAACFLLQSVGDSEQELSRDVIALNAGCIVPVFYDISEKHACFMGGDAGRKSDEAPVQKVIRDIILQHPEAYPPKTDGDKTDEELEFDALDIEEIFNNVDKTLSEDKQTLAEMADGEIRLETEGSRGTIFYKKNGKGVSHLFRVDDEEGKKITLETLEIAEFCLPKTAPLKGKKLEEFKSDLEAYLTENGYSFEYAGEKK